MAAEKRRPILSSVFIYLLSVHTLLHSVLDPDFWFLPSSAQRLLCPDIFRACLQTLVMNSKLSTLQTFITIETRYSVADKTNTLLSILLPLLQLLHYSYSKFPKNPTPFFTANPSALGAKWLIMSIDTKYRFQQTGIQPSRN